MAIYGIQAPDEAAECIEGRAIGLARRRLAVARLSE